MPLDRTDIPEPFRIYALETRADTVDAAIDRERKRGDRLDASIGTQAITLAEHDAKLSDLKETTDERIVALVTTTDKLATSLNRVMWALVGFSVTVASSSVALLIGGIPSHPL